MALVKATSVHDDYHHFPPQPDRALFDHAWSRVRDLRDHTGWGIGVGLHEAKHWHRRAYGSLGELGQMSPGEVGHAAAYEAYRSWRRNKYMYDSQGIDRERQREGLIGLAVAEASRLLQYLPHHSNHYHRTMAAEAAAFTASVLFHQNYDSGGHHYRSPSRRGSWSEYETDSYDSYDSSDYEHGHHHYPRSRSRSHSRPRSHSHHRSSYHPSNPPAVIQIGGATPAYTTSNVPGVAYPTQPYGTYGSAYSTYGATPAITYPASTTMSAPYLGRHGHNSSIPIVMPTATSVPYNPTYAGAAPGAQMIVIPSHRKHHHRHRRSRSVDPSYVVRY